MRGDGSQSLGGDLGVDGGHVLHEVDDAAGVAPLVVVPGDELDEVGVEHDAGPGIEDAAAGVGLEVGGHEGLVAVAQDALHLALGLGLDDGADLLVGGLLPELAGEVDHGDVDGGDAEGHAGELALEGGDDLGHGLRGAGGGGDDVAGGSAAAAPVLAGGGVDDGLGGGHEGLLDVELVVDGLDHGGEAVGGAGRAGHEVLAAVVLVGVDAHDDGLGVVLSGGRVDNLLGAAVQNGLGLPLGEEDAGGLADVVGPEGAPADLLGVAAAGGLDLLPVEAEPALMPASLMSSSSIMIRVTRRPMRPKPLTPMPVDMVVEAELDADDRREVPAKEYPEAVPAEARAKATANFIVLVRCVITLSK